MRARGEGRYHPRQPSRANHPSTTTPRSQPARVPFFQPMVVPMRERLCRWTWIPFRSFISFSRVHVYTRPSVSCTRFSTLVFFLFRYRLLLSLLLSLRFTTLRLLERESFRRSSTNMTGTRMFSTIFHILTSNCFMSVCRSFLSSTRNMAELSTI